MQRAGPHQLSDALLRRLPPRTRAVHRATAARPAPPRNLRSTQRASSPTQAEPYTDGPYELGVKIQSSQAGQIVPVPYYKDAAETGVHTDRKSTRLNSSHLGISY